MTQKDMIFNHLKQHGEITSWDAIMQYGVTRLADIVYRLKKDGYKISTEIIVKKKGNRTITFAKYRLER